jgi:hypothetical protein
MRKRSWDSNDLKNAVASSKSIRQVLFKLNLVPAGGNYEQVKNTMKDLSLDFTHFTGKLWNKGLKIPRPPMLTLDRILVAGSTFQSFKLKARLFQAGIKTPECGWCKKSEDGRIPLELDHINGDRHDNRLGNLRVLCPNCHSLKHTHRGRNKRRRGGVIGSRV